MPKGHQRSRSSIDRVIDLLADLEENQISVLLDDLNHTTSSNVAVTDAIALFEHHANKPKRRSCRSPSPLRTLQVELERRHSKRLSAAPERQSRYKAAISQPPAPREPATPSPSPSPPPAEDLLGRPNSPDRPSLILPASASFEHPKTSSAGPPPAFRPRSYKRISRPMFLSPTATAELHLLLLAFFNETLPVSPTTTATPSPTTPLFGFSHSPFTDFEVEPNTPGLELLEPSPTRTPSFSGGRSLKTMPSISSIFEVMRSQ
ncbi:hypothetical protein B0I37DRAFT_372223 [Chaetomium sp. MPI-CAGE-AT-0009]|nr:hypothetical protein B0I37DRAFT_372223 [Chaetomium sp. MPI-CAGE-AT-0009]